MSNIALLVTVMVVVSLYETTVIEFKIQQIATSIIDQIHKLFSLTNPSLSSVMERIILPIAEWFE